MFRPTRGSFNAHSLILTGRTRPDAPVLAVSTTRFSGEQRRRSALGRALPARRSSDEVEEAGRRVADTEAVLQGASHSVEVPSPSRSSRPERSRRRSAGSKLPCPALRGGGPRRRGTALGGTRRGLDGDSSSVEGVRGVRARAACTWETPEELVCLSVSSNSLIGNLRKGH